MAKQDDFLGLFIGNRDRARLLRVFMFNQSDVLTLGDITKRSGVSLRTAKRELKLLTNLGIIKNGLISVTLKNGKRVTGKQRVPAWTVNQDFKHVRAVSVFIHEVASVRHENIVGALRKSGGLSTIILSGSFMGDTSRPADIVVAADPLNERRLESAIRSLEPVVGREIRYAAFSTPEFRYRLTIQDRLLRDTLDFPHIVLLDRTRML